MAAGARRRMAATDEGPGSSRRRRCGSHVRGRRTAWLRGWRAAGQLGGCRRGRQRPSRSAPRSVTSWYSARELAHRPTGTSPSPRPRGRGKPAPSGLMSWRPDGGSLVVEQRLDKPRVYHVHWAGAHTSEGADGLRQQSRPDDFRLRSAVAVERGRRRRRRAPDASAASEPEAGAASATCPARTDPGARRRKRRNSRTG